MDNLGEIRPQHFQHIGLGPAGQHFGHKRAARLQHVNREIKRGLNEGHNADMVSPFVARRKRRHVRHHHIGHATKPVFHLVIGVILQKIQHVDFGPRNMLDLLKVNPQHGAYFFALALAKRIYPLHRHLAPATGRAAEVYHLGTGQQKAVFIVEFHDLISRPAPVSLTLGALHIRVIQLPLQPQGAGQLAALGGFYPHLQVTLATA